MATTMERLDEQRGQVDIKSGPVSYIDTGGPGRPVLFVHGLATSSYLWRNVIDQLRGERRCVALDLPLHGDTPAAADQDFSLPGLAGFAGPVRGRAAAVRYRPGRQRHRRGDLPGVHGGGSRPPALAHAHQLRGAGQLAAQGAAAGQVARAGRPVRLHDALADARPAARPPDHVRHRLRGPRQPARGDIPGLAGRDVGTGRGRARQNQRILPSMRSRDLLALEPALRRLQVPTLIVWGTGDRFFGTKWAYWLPTPFPAPPRWWSSTGRGCSFLMNGPGNWRRRSAGTGRRTPDTGQVRSSLQAMDSVRALHQIAFQLERASAPTYRVRAFRRAAQVVAGASGAGAAAAAAGRAAAGSSQASARRLPRSSSRRSRTGARLPAGGCWTRRTSAAADGHARSPAR